MDSTVMPNAACGVLSMHVVGSTDWYASNRVAYDLLGPQADGMPILITQSKLCLTTIAHAWKK